MLADQFDDLDLKTRQVACDDLRMTLSAFPRNWHIEDGTPGGEGATSKTANSVSTNWCDLESDRSPMALMTFLG